MSEGQPPMGKVGCCGFPVGMRNYFASFKLVELQRPFYKLPHLKTALKWREEAPPDFEFSLKAPQIITHPATSPTYRKAGLVIDKGKLDDYGFFRPTEVVREAWRQAEELARALEVQVVLFQCPASFDERAEHIENMRRFFNTVHRRGLVFVWEPRGAWHDEVVQSLCRELELIHVVDPLEKAPLYGSLNYFRLHGGSGYRHKYSDAELARVRRLASRKETYVLFNNIAMLQDASRFLCLLRAQEKGKP